MRSGEQLHGRTCLVVTHAEIFCFRLFRVSVVSKLYQRVQTLSQRSEQGDFSGTSPFCLIGLVAGLSLDRTADSGQTVLTGFVANRGILFRAKLSCIIVIGPVPNAFQHIQAAYLEFLPQ